MSQKVLHKVVHQVPKTVYHIREKLLNADWLRRSAFFLILEATFGNQEGTIT